MGTRDSRLSAYVVLILTLTPWAFWIGLFAMFGENPPDAAALEAAQTIPLWVWAMMLVVVLTLGLIVYYIVHLYTKSGLTGLQRGLWLLLLLFGNLFAMPFYWLLFIWLKREAESAAPAPLVDDWPAGVPALGTTAGELLDASMVLAKRNYWSILRCALPALILAFALEALLDLLDASSGFLGTMVSFLPWSLVEALCIAGCWSLLHGRSCNFGDSWQMISPRLGTVITTFTMKWVAITFGLFLLIVPGLFAIVRFFALPTVSITERASFGTAISRTLGLSRGRFKLLAASVGLLDLLSIGLSMLIPLALPGGSWETPSKLDTFTASIVYVMLLPIRTALLATVYLSLRMSKEGYDLSVSLGNLSRP